MTYAKYLLVSDGDTILFESYDYRNFINELKDWLYENDLISWEYIEKMSTKLLFDYIEEIHETEIKFTEVL